VLDRRAVNGSISNGAIQFKGDDGSLLRPYFFTVEAESLKKTPLIPGAVYILQHSNVEPDHGHANIRYGQYTLYVAQWLCRGEIQPIAKLPVGPEDFPFLDFIWGYETEVLSRRMDADLIA